VKGQAAQSEVAGISSLLAGWRGLWRSLRFAARERDGWRLLRFPLQGSVDLLLFEAGRVVAWLQTRLGIQAPPRGLSSPEVALAREVLGGSFDAGTVRVVEGRCGVLGLPARAFVLGDTIFLPDRWRRRDPDSDLEATLVHELVHVWQYRTRGLRYLSEALWVQWFGEGYDYRRGLQHGRTWGRLNPEQQAQLVEEAWRRGDWVAGEPEDAVLAEAVREAREELA